MTPIVLHHGLLGFPNLKTHGADPSSATSGLIDRVLLAERGHPVIVTRVHPTAGVERRERPTQGETILRQLLDILGCQDEKVVIIGHSLGGLDAALHDQQIRDGRAGVGSP